MSSCKSRAVFVLTAWAFACASCTLAMLYFDGLLGSGSTYPYESHSQLLLAVCRTAFTATLASSWALWLGANQGRRIRVRMLQTGLAMQGSLTLYGIAGWQHAIGGFLLSPHLDLIFPPAFFAEYNWLTFIFEVAPVTSLVASLRVYAMHPKRA